MVLIQAKKYEDVETQDLIHGVRTVTHRGFDKAKIRRCAHFYRLFGSASIDMSFLRMQYATVDTVPFIENDKNDYAALATETKDVLASIPLGLEVKSAHYPVSHLFTSWPGEGKPRADAREQKLAKGAEAAVRHR